MKRYYFLLLLGIASVLWSCKKEHSDEVNGDNSFHSTLSSGTWKVTSFTSANTDHTADFADFRFMFDANGHTNAANTLFSVDGSWSANENVSPVTLALDYPDADAPQIFTDLSGTYDVIAYSSVKVQCRKQQAGGGPSADVLVLERIQ